MPSGWPNPSSETTDPLMGELTEALKQMEWPIRRRFGDETGTFCLRVGTPRGQVYVTAKAYAYAEQASFPERVLNRARDQTRPVCLFFREGGFRLGNAYAYNPRVVTDEGTRNLSDESRHDREYYYDIPLSRGAVLGAYVAGHESLPGGPVQSAVDAREPGTQRSFQSLDLESDE